MNRKGIATVAIALVAVALTACASSGAPQEASDPRFEVNATVLEAPHKPAMLCLGGIATSLPPQCGGFPIPNWDWDEVTHEEEASGTTWGEYHLVGTFDGETYTLDAPPGPYQTGPPTDEDRFLSPCPEPAGGWRALDPSRTTEQTQNQAFELAREQPDFGGSWIDNRSKLDGYTDPNETIINVRFTGNLAEHEAQLREVWGGSLCVSSAEHTFRRLEEINDEIWASVADELGLSLLSGSVDPVANNVSIDVVTADAETLRALDDRYGEGVVKVTTALKPL